jgi:hypothetical protein
MPKHLFAVTLILLIFFSSFCFVQSKFLTVQVTFSGTLNIFALNQGRDSNGTGFVNDNSLNYVISNWPNFEADKKNFRLEQTAPQLTPRPNNVNFNFVISLGDIKKNININDFREAGRYTGTVTCVFSGLHSGTYNLTINLYVDNFYEIDSQLVHTLNVQ